MIPENSENVESDVGRDDSRRAVFGMGLVSPPGWDTAYVAFVDAKGKLLGGIKNLGTEPELPVGDVTGFKPTKGGDSVGCEDKTVVSKWGSQSIKEAGYRTNYKLDTSDLDTADVEAAARFIDRKMQEHYERVLLGAGSLWPSQTTTMVSTPIEALTIEKLDEMLREMEQEQRSQDEKMIEALLKMGCDLKLEGGDGDRITVTLPAGRYAKSYNAVRARSFRRSLDPYQSYYDAYGARGTMS